jgi:hypothetical protein
MREIRIRIPTPEDIIYGEAGKHLLKAYKEFLLALASIPQGQIEVIEELEKKVEKKKG